MNPDPDPVCSQRSVPDPDPVQIGPDPQHCFARTKSNVITVPDICPRLKYCCQPILALKKKFAFKKQYQLIFENIFISHRMKEKTDFDYIFGGHSIK